MRALLLIGLILSLATAAHALTQSERDAEMVCMSNMDMRHSSGSDVTIWKYKRGYEICERVYPAIQRQRALEDDEAARYWTNENQKNLKAAARELGVEP
jgi:hypothetical protein